MKKKLLIGILTVASAFAIIGAGTAIVLTGNSVQSVSAERFIDEDGDGVCDNCNEEFEAHGQQNCGENFVDEDGDGVCDNKNSANGQHKGCGKGQQNGCGKRNGQQNGCGKRNGKCNGRN